MNDKLEFDVVWARIVAHAGEEFQQIRGGRFTYQVAGDYLDLDRTNQMVSKAQLAEAYEMVPLQDTVPVQHLRAPSYLYAILMDERIRQTNW